MNILSDIFMQYLDKIQSSHQSIAYAGVPANMFEAETHGCRNECSGSCEGSCYGSCDASCSGGKYDDDDFGETYDYDD